jgi:streptogramin lyase
MRRKVLAGAVVVIVLVAALAVYAAYTLQGPCQPVKASETTTNQLKSTTFGAVTEYSLPNPSHWANAITALPDGSVWFGEQALPGVGHFNPTTGTLVEYKWPCYPTSKTGGVVSSIWGIKVWNGKVWAADGDANRLVGLDPADGTVTYVNTTSAQFPYLLAVAPDGSLWFTSLSAPAKLGRLGLDLGLSLYSVAGLGHKEPIQILFVNSSLAYMAALNPYTSTDSGVYSFDPRNPGPTIMVTKVGGDFRLLFPDSVSVAAQTVWVAQHYPSNLLGYNSVNGSWTIFPTPTLSYENTTLPYFVEASGSRVWFNEHYANKIALLDPAGGRLTEFSESDPPPSNSSGIQNDLTIAATSRGLWFTSVTGNYIGFVDGGFKPGFSIAVVGSNSADLAAGGNLTARFEVSGSWSGPISVHFADSEGFTSFPRLISIQADRETIGAGTGPITLSVTISAKSNLQPGRYTVGVTVTDGLLYQTAYFFLDVT